MTAVDPDPAALWQDAVRRLLKGGDPAQLAWHSRDGFVLPPLSPPAPGRDLLLRSPPDRIGIVQLVDDPDPAAAGEAAKEGARNGATALTLACAGCVSARSFGLDLARPDLRVLFADLGDIGAALRCELPPHAEARDIDAVLAAADGRVDLTFLRDPLGDAARSGRFDDANDADPAATLDRWLAVCSTRSLSGPALHADGRFHHEAGASEAQELAAVLSTGVAYLRGLDRAGLDPRSLAFTLAADTDQILTMAKCRALRRLWARVEDASGLAPAPIRLHGETAWRMLTRHDAWTNLVRNTVACAGAILGGCDSVTVLPFTNALGLADGFARRLARNTPLILLEEAHLGRVADPGAGSGSVEAATDALCGAAWRLFQDLERRGGLAAALVAGRWQAALAAARAARRADLDAGQARIVGVTAFAPDAETPPAVLVAAPRDVPGDTTTGDFSALPSTRDAQPFEDEAAP